MAHGHNVVLELDFGQGAKGKKRYAVVKELQFHPVKRYLQHVDLHEVDLAEEIEGQVPIETVGTAAGLIDGGVMDWERREVTVRALPGDMPSSLEIDVSAVEIGHHLTVAALVVPDGVAVVDDPEAVILALLPPRVEQVAEAVEGEEAAEPEVVGGHESEE